MPLPQPIEFCFHLWKLIISLTLLIEFFQYLILNSLVENTFLHVPLNHFLHHELYKQLLNIRRLQFRIINIIQFSRHLTTSTSILTTSTSILTTSTTSILTTSTATIHNFLPFGSYKNNFHDYTPTKLCSKQVL